MPNNPNYSKYHPKWYRERKPIFWWVHKWEHTRFMLRELTCVFIAFYALVLLSQLRALSQGAEAYSSFLTWLQMPVNIFLHSVVFLFVIFHSVTWFNLASKAMVIRIGRKRIPGWLIASLNYVAWGVFSVAIAWIILQA
jgi:fumarate reductase subunit C